MTQFSEAIRSFLAGELDFSGLDRALQQAVQTGQGSRAELEQLLDQIYRAGRLPPQLHVILKSRLAAPVTGQAAESAPTPPAPTGVAAGENADDSTRVLPGRPAAGSSDRTVLGNAPPVLDSVTGSPADSGGEGGAADDATRVSHTVPGVTTGRTGPGAVTGQTGPDAVTGQTGPGVTTSQTSGTGGTDSSWSNLEAAADETTGEIGPGAVLKGRFVLEQILGRGGMGEVYKARDLRKEEAQDRNPWLAVKILNESFKSHPESLKALQRESRKAQKLAHPNIVNVYDFDRDGATVFMTMEYLEGEPLDHITKQHRGRGLPEAEALKIINDMGQALSHAHRHGIVHSDFKPGNAFLTKEGITKVFDFGIARASTHAGDATGEATLFDAGKLGALTPAYASYEMLEGAEPDERDDIYALACVAYELLAGRHPFNKLPANQALDQGLVPERIKSLGRGQWKALARGLAFERERRSASVEEFLHGIARKRLHRGIIIGAAAAVLLVIVLLVATVPDYLHERRLALIVRELKSGDSAGMNAALESVRGLAAYDRSNVLLESKVEILDWYRRRQDELVNELQGRYDYPAAEREIEAALELFPDSAQLHEQRSRLENSRDQLLNNLNQRFNGHLQEGRLLPSGEDDMEDVLAILAQVQPDHPLLSDARLPAAYASQATQLLERGELRQSMDMLLAGLQRFAQDSSLVNLRDRVLAEQARVEREQRIAALATQLESALDGLETLAQVESVRPELVELKRLEPGTPVVRKIQARAGKLIDSELAALTAGRRWDEGETLLQNYVDVIEPDFMKSRHEQLSKARDTYLARMDSLYSALLEAVGNRRLTGRSSNSAQSLLQKLADEGSDAATLERARSAIGQAYLELARDARAGGNWDDARKQVESGLGQQPGASMSASLRAELAEIARAEDAQQQQLAVAELREREAERQRQIDTLHASFAQSLEQAPYQAESARKSMAILDRLAGVSPSDPQVGTGRSQVAERLLGSIRALGNAQQWDEALALSREAVEVIPGSEQLSSVMVEIERGRSQQLARTREQNINHYRQQLAAALEKPLLDDNWTTSVQDDLKILGDLMAADQQPWLEEQRARIAALYVEKSRDMRRSDRFSEARSLLESARRFVPDDAVYATEQQALADAEAKFLKANEQKLTLARIEGDKQTFLTQAKARDVTSANRTLASLRKELPADDPFLTSTAPGALADAYLRLAESAAKKGNYGPATKLVDAGLAEAPDNAGLQNLRKSIDRERRVSDARKLLQSTAALGAAGVRAALDELKKDSDIDYPSVEKELSAIVVKRITALAGKDYDAAVGMLEDAKSLFPSNTILASLKLEKSPSGTGGDTGTGPEPPPDTKKPPKGPITPPVGTQTAGVGCMPGLAGYGKKARGTCYDMLPGDTRGPLLVVIPSGGGISEPFAISKYEISVADYNSYCKRSGKCTGVRAASNELPVTGISLQEARAYAEWISSQTGYTYRIPTDAEWSYAASAQGKQPGKDFNCRVMLGDQLIRGQALSSVNVGKPNGWGLINYIGNAQEWVTTGSGTAVRGGAFQDNMSSCELTLSKAHSGQADDLTGFRLVRTLRLGG